jgi:hypothetical protein
MDAFVLDLVSAWLSYTSPVKYIVNGFSLNCL